MAEQLTGAGVGLVLVLGYVLLVQALAAAIVLLGQFILIQWRFLWSLVAEAPRPVPAPAREIHEARGEDQGETQPVYVIGGNLRRWE
jgi:hypothetical protein